MRRISTRITRLRRRLSPDWWVPSVVVVLLAAFVPLAFGVVRGVSPITGFSSVPTLIAGGTTFSVSGCSATTPVGGATAGQFASGTTGTCVATITLPTAPHGWTCYATDVTNTANFTQNASSTTSCGVTGATTTGDSVHFLAMGY